MLTQSNEKVFKAKNIYNTTKDIQDLRVVKRSKTAY